MIEFAITQSESLGKSLSESTDETLSSETSPYIYICAEQTSELTSASCESSRADAIMKRSFPYRDKTDELVSRAIVGPSANRHLRSRLSDFPSRVNRFPFLSCPKNGRRTMHMSQKRDASLSRRWLLQATLPPGRSVRTEPRESDIVWHDDPPRRGRDRSRDFRKLPRTPSPSCLIAISRRLKRRHASDSIMRTLYRAINPFAMDIRHGEFVQRSPYELESWFFI